MNKRLTDAVGKAVRAVLPDLLIFAGAGAVSWGAGLIYLPAGLIVGGALALAGGLFLSRGA